MANKVVITNTTGNTLSVVVDGDSYELDADTVQIAADEDSRKTTLTLSGLASKDQTTQQFKFPYTGLTVAGSSVASNAAAILAIDALTASGTIVNYSAPATGVTLVPSANKARRLIIIVNPSGTIAAHTITLPAFKDGQILTVCPSQIITSWTITPNGTASFVGALTAGAAGVPKSWIYNATADKFFPC